MLCGIYILRTWQGPQKLFRAFFIFFNFFYFFDFFLIFSIFFARTVLRTWQGPQKLFRAFFIFFYFFDFFDFFLIFSIFFARTVYITIQSDRVYIDIYIKDLARAPEIVPSIFYFFQFFFYFFDFFLIFSIFFARTVYITIQSDRVYTYIYIYRYRHFGHFLTHFAALSVTDTKQMVTIWTSRFEDLSLNCDLC